MYKEILSNLKYPIDMQKFDGYQNILIRILKELSQSTKIESDFIMKYRDFVTVEVTHRILVLVIVIR